MVYKNKKDLHVYEVYRSMIQLQLLRTTDDQFSNIYCSYLSTHDAKDMPYYMSAWDFPPTKCSIHLR